MLQKYFRRLLVLLRASCNSYFDISIQWAYWKESCFLCLTMLREYTSTW